MELFFDVETTGLPTRGAPCFNLDAYSDARIVSIAWILRSKERVMSQRYSIIRQSDTYSESEEPLGGSHVHGITRKDTSKFGKDLTRVLNDFVQDVALSDRIVAHNIDFDVNVVGSELYRLGVDPSSLLNQKRHCTMKTNTEFFKKWPTLGELVKFCFHTEIEDSHNALADAQHTAKCYYFIRDNIVDLTK